MVKKSLIIALAEAAYSNNRSTIAKVCAQIAEGETDNSTLSKRITWLSNRYPVLTQANAMHEAEINQHTLIKNSITPLSDVFITDKQRETIANTLKCYSSPEIMEEFGLGNSCKLLLDGPPGNGKTTLAESISHELNLPLLVVDFTKILSSGFGESAAKLGKLFRAASSTNCVLFIDEMETVLHERSTVSRDVGEVKRIVSSLLLEIDRLPSNVFLIGATNHAELLDRAVKRRFNVSMQLDKPDQETIKGWISLFCATHPNIPFDQLDVDINCESISELETNVINAARKWVVENKL